MTEENVTKRFLNHVRAIYRRDKYVSVHDAAHTFLSKHGVEPKREVVQAMVDMYYQQRAIG